MPFQVAGQTFECDERYKLTRDTPLGQGAYGVVAAAHDTKTGEPVAIKKICSVFEDLTTAKRTLRELKLLTQLKHENVLTLKNIMVPPTTKEKCEDVYIVTDLMDTNLHLIIRSEQELTDDHVQYFLYQIIRALKYTHSAHVLHRDLKPSNILVNANCDLKLCDFGLARLEEENANEGMTQYVVTRWYRAPELLWTNEYTSAIDMWAAGCIFAELLGRRTLFPGKDYKHQLEIIIKRLGKPSEEDLAHIQQERTKQFIRNIAAPPEKEPFQNLFPDANPQAIDLLDKMLRFHPGKRISADEALNHPYLAPLKEDDDPPSAKAPFKFDFVQANLNKDYVRDLIWDVAKGFDPDNL